MPPVQPCPKLCLPQVSGPEIETTTSVQKPEHFTTRLLRRTGCCTDVVGLISGPDTCGRQSLGITLKNVLHLSVLQSYLNQINNKKFTPNPKSGWNTFPTTLTLSGPCPVNCIMRDNGCGLQDDEKFWNCRTSGQFPNWNFVRLSSPVVKWSGCCTDLVGSIPWPDTCDMQRLGQGLGITLKNVLDLSVLHSYLNQINNKTLTPNTKSGCTTFPTKYISYIHVF